jgi:hypothetical protein
VVKNDRFLLTSGQQKDKRGDDPWKIFHHL